MRSVQFSRCWIRCELVALQGCASLSRRSCSIFSQRRSARSGPSACIAPATTKLRGDATPCQQAHHSQSSSLQQCRPGRVASRRALMLTAHSQRETTDDRQGIPSAVPPKDAPDTDTGVDSTNGDDMNAARSPQPEQRPRFAVPGQLIILTVALLWGTNPPALRYLYASDGTTFLRASD